LVVGNLLMLLILFAFGLCFGSFLNVIVYRLPHKLSIVTPPSSCPACKTRLSFFDLIPLLSYLWLKGKCRYCSASISIRYPLVELLTGLLFVAVFYRFGFSATGLFYLVLLYLLLAVTLIDLEHRIVPNPLVAAGLITGLIFYLPVLLSLVTEIPPWILIDRLPLDGLLGFLIGGGLLLIIILVSRGGMGAGDMKLMAMIGLFVGLRGVAVVLLAAFIFGALVGIAMMLLGQATRKSALPFAPYLALATVVEVFWGEAIWNWYINLIL
jgi:leader peptidase (prepilin peptidase) / N-methyltransferase